MFSGLCNGSVWMVKFSGAKVRVKSQEALLQDAKAAEKAVKKQKALDKEAARLKEAAEKSQNGSASRSRKAATKDAKVCAVITSCYRHDSPHVLVGFLEALCLA